MFKLKMRQHFQNSFFLRQTFSKKIAGTKIVPAASLIQKRNNITQNKMVYSYQQKMHRTEGFNPSTLFIFFFDLALPLVVFPDLLCFLLVGIAGGRAKSRVNSDGTKGTDGCLLPNKTLYAPLRCPCFVLGYP
jgi:hypothetical protein